MISNGSGNVTSRAARLTVTAAASAPTITTQPADQSIHAGQTATFTVLATGSAPLSYQWRRNGTAIPGATSASYTTPSQSTSDSGATFSVVISNGSGNVTSRAARLTVTAAASAPTITTQPADQSIACRADRHLHCARHRQRAAVLPVAPQRHGDSRCHQRQLYDPLTEHQ